MTLNDISCCPAEIIKDLITHSNLRKGSKILEIGSDNGTITNLLTNKGFSITCNESNKELIDIAKSNISDLNVSYVEGNFEEQVFGKRKYDLVLANETFESIPQPIGYIKCHEVLKDEGHFAIIENICLSNEFESIADFVSETECKDRMDKISNALYSTGIFSKPRVYKKAWSKEYTVDEYFAFLLTFDSFMSKDTETKKGIYEELSSKYKGKIRVDYLTILYISKKRTDLTYK